MPLIDGMNPFQVFTFDRAIFGLIQTNAEQTVDHDIPVLIVRDIGGNFTADGQPRLHGLLGIRRNEVAVAGKYHSDRISPFLQMTRHHKCIATIVAWAGKYQYVAMRVL